MVTQAQVQDHDIMRGSFTDDRGRRHDYVELLLSKEIAHISRLMIMPNSVVIVTSRDEAGVASALGDEGIQITYQETQEIGGVNPEASTETLYQIHKEQAHDAIVALANYAPEGQPRLAPRGLDLATKFLNAGLEVEINAIGADRDIQTIGCFTNAVQQAAQAAR